MFHISTFYDCCERDNSFLKQSLTKRADELSIVGTIILTPEGINSTIACANLKNLYSFETYIAKYFPSIDIGRSCAETKPFKRFKIKERQELVPSGTNLKPTDYAASHVAPESWNEFSKNINTILIDVRNNYETLVGTFKGALNPDTRNFREFKHFVIASLASCTNFELHSGQLIGSCTNFSSTFLNSLITLITSGIISPAFLTTIVSP